MKKKAAVLFLLTVLSVSWLAVTARADTGPKPSVQITFENMGDEVCYGTLLSKHESTGPASVWDGDEEHIYANGLDMEIWRAFVGYEDADGFFFLQWGWQCNETKMLNWGYYPPSPFKILLYYPEAGTFIVSEICERYAFDSYFTVNMEGVGIASVNEAPVLSPEKSYEYGREAGAFVCRVVLTVLPEIGIALLFSFRRKKQLLLIGGINTVTQIALNLALNLTNHDLGYAGFVRNYLLSELIVFAVEAAIYARLFSKVGDQPVKPGKPIVYALTANAVSFTVGLAVAKLIPGIF